MMLGHDKSLEDYVERFQLTYKRVRCALNPESLIGMREDILETLNMLLGGEIYQLSDDDIKTIFKNHSRASRKKGRASQYLANSSFSNTSIKSEIMNMLKEFKSEMVHTLSLQVDTMQINRKQEEAERALVVFCPRFT